MADFGITIHGSPDYIDNNELSAYELYDMVRYEYPEILIGQTPKTLSWSLPPLFKTSQTTGTLVWQVAFDGERGVILRQYGYAKTTKGVLGNLQEAEPHIVVPKVKRNLQEQALQEASQMYRIQYRNEGYRPANETDVTESFYVNLQLAQRYYRPGQIVDGKEKRCPISQNHFPLACQIKVDGNRTVAVKRGEDVSLYTRSMNQWAYCEELREELSRFFDYLPDGYPLDGELYSETIPFDMIQSAAKTTVRKHEYNSQLRFFIFDIIIPDIIVEERIDIIVNAARQFEEDGNNPQRIVIIPTFVANTYEEIDTLFMYFVSLGYEGLMFRKLCNGSTSKRKIEQSYYKGGRNVNLFKYKEFFDEEGTIIEVYEGSGKEAGLAMFRIQDDNGNIFGCRPKGEYDVRKSWFDNRNDIIGRRYTFKYFEKTKDGVPRFPVGIRFRDDF
jgi:DNA ligase-1